MIRSFISEGTVGPLRSRKFGAPKEEWERSDCGVPTSLASTAFPNGSVCLGTGVEGKCIGGCPLPGVSDDPLGIPKGNCKVTSLAEILR